MDSHTNSTVTETMYHPLAHTFRIHFLLCVYMCRQQRNESHVPLVGTHISLLAKNCPKLFLGVGSPAVVAPTRCVLPYIKKPGEI